MANETQAAQGTKTLVWQLAHPLHARLIEPEHHGTSKAYRFDPQNRHTVEVDEADAAVIMAGPDRDEFRIKAD